MDDSLREELMSVDPQEKLTYLRNRARDSLLEYVSICDPTYEDSLIHRVLATILEATEKRKIRRVAISCPPRHGKSRLISEEFPSWILGRNPKAEIICASYASERSDKISINVRDRIETNENYKLIFPETSVTPYNRKRDSWTTTSSGQFLSSGVGGSITGMGADYLIIDDPLKNREEAESPTQRNRVWDWFTSTAMTRLSPNGVCVIIMTRWHDDDLVGRLTSPEYLAELKDAGLEDERFRLYNFPAIAEHSGDVLGRKEGEALWPERWTVDHLRRIRHTIGRYDWYALYQGKPRAKGGNYINRDWFNTKNRDEIPEGLRWKRYWDLASSVKTYSDYTCSIKGAFDKQGNLWLDGMIRGKWLWPDARKKIVTTALIESIIIGTEAGGMQNAPSDDVKNELHGKIVVKSYAVDKDKLTRALKWIALAEAGKVFIVTGDWMWDFFDQCEAFPNATHDDMIDAVSGVHKMLSEATIPILV